MFPVVADARGATGKSAPEQESSSATETVQEVTVTAQRAKLEERVEQFVSKITPPLFDAGLTLWRDRVCPLVSGLPREQSEFVLSRISEVARAADVPVAGEQCLPNLFILVTPRPRELLRWMERRELASTFGFDANRGVINEFISKSAPVKILYRDVSGSIPSYPYLSSAKAGPVTMAGDNWTYDSHAPFWDGVWHVFRAFVIVDRARVTGVTVGQFADRLGSGLPQSPLHDRAGVTWAALVHRACHGERHLPLIVARVSPFDA